MKSLKSSSKLGAIRRKAVDASAGSLVKMAPLREEGPLPLLVQPQMSGVDLIDWVAQNRELVNRRLIECGAVLFRGFTLGSTAEFENLVKALSGAEELLRYTYRSTPRSQVEGRIYTSTEYPPDQSIPMHNEMSYSRSWPRKIWFYCVQAALQEGETPLADSRKVYQRIDPRLREKFISRGVMYVRNYGGGLDLPWQNAFNTDDRPQVEAFCQESGIECEWLAGDRLRTRQVCQAVSSHPETGQPVWFNQAHLFHVSSLKEELRRSLLEDLSQEDLPRNAYFGDGSPFDADDLEPVRQAFEQELVVFPWQNGDLLLVDNMLTAHGRRPFQGPRKVLVGMAESMRMQAA